MTKEENKTLYVYVLYHRFPPHVHDALKSISWDKCYSTDRKAKKVESTRFYFEVEEKVLNQKQNIVGILHVGKKLEIKCVFDDFQKLIDFMKTCVKEKYFGSYL